MPQNLRVNPKKKVPVIDLHVKTVEIPACSSSLMVWEDVQVVAKDSGTAQDPPPLGPNKSTNNLSVHSAITKIFNSSWMEEGFAPIVNESFDGKNKIGIKLT
jgi:hypothetical protein